MSVIATLYAAGEVPPFVPAMAIIIVSAAVAGWLSQRARLVPIIGFLIAGVVIGPNALGLVDDVATVELVAEIGVILLLFTIGIELSLDRLARIRTLVLGGGSLTVSLATAVVMLVILATGASWQVALYTGLLVSVSSTAVVYAILNARRETTTQGGRLSIGVLIFEDLAVVAMVLVVPMLGNQGGSAAEVARTLLLAVVVIAAVLLIARKVMPAILETVAKACSPEVFLLSVIAICFAIVFGASYAGVGISLGAFLAGLAVSESRFSSHALGEVLPLQIIFTATLFVSLGMLFDPSFLLERPLLVVAAVVGVLVIKSVTGTVAARLVGIAAPVAVASALMRAQIGEFALVLEQIGQGAGLSPAGLGDDGAQAFLASALVLMIATPALAPAGAWIGSRLPAGPSARAARRSAAAPSGDGATEPDEESFDHLHDHVVVAGYGAAARALVPHLRAANIPFLVVTLNPLGASHVESTGLPVLRGDTSRRHTLEAAGVRRARMVVIADDDTEMAVRISEVVRTINPDTTIVVRADADHDAVEIAAGGADVVVTGARASAKWLSHTVLAAYDQEMGLAARLGGPTVDQDRIITFDPAPSACAHTGQILPVLPSAPGCEDCLQNGDEWVHLRICLACGYVGCCDDSANRHARAHAGAASHAIARSIEPGERWAWCYPEELELRPLDR
jgi:CPA2 family monovalent cation:H+ antiporter-2